MPDLKKVLHKYFGHPDFRFGQEDIISAILSGEQVIAVLPTGAGKSLCYQLPALISENFSIVISPLIALMKDQVDNLNKNTETAAFINSTMTFYESEEVLQKISYGNIKLLYVAPERLDNKSFADKISQLNPAFLFVDEAHCISEWGHNFRPSYTKINEFIKYCSIKKVSAFTATATPEVVIDIGTQLNFNKPRLFVKGFERDNLHLNVHIDVKKNIKAFELLSVTEGSAIIYTSSRKSSEELAEYLSLKGISCGYYHAGLSSIYRRKIQEDFINDRLRVICATNAFGMGIDKKDIRLIIHYNIPGSIENYYQEIGRAGRDNKSSYIHLFYDEKDINIQDFFISNSHPTKDLIQKVYSAICDFNQVAVGSQAATELIVDEKYISNHAGIIVSKGLLHSALKFLENAGYMRMVSEFEKKDTIQLLMSKNKIEEFVRRTSSAELKNTLLILLREFGSELFSKYKQITLGKISELIDTSEETLHSSLITLDNLGIISYRPSLKEESVLLTAPRIEKERLQLNYKKINESYLNARKKLDKMIDYVFTNDCRFKHIISYFGENVEDYNCGKCDCCVVSNKITDSTVDYLSEILISTLAEVGKPFPENSLIRIIRGESEKESFESFANFGSASNYNKNELKIIIQSLISRKQISISGGKQKYLELTPSSLDKLEKAHKEIIKTNDYEKDLELYHHLRMIRKNASERFLQTAYLLCPDKVLSKVAKEKPKTRNELLNIEGFNTRMFNKIGDEFLEAIKKYVNSEKPAKKKSDIPQNIKGTYDLLLKQYSLKEIARLRKLPEPVVSMQIETILEYMPDCDIDYLFDKGIIELSEKEIKKGFTSLKELKERLPGKITFAQIRIVAAKYKSTHHS
jgi:ATP-dependent DNA helicase RecQ